MPRLSFLLCAAAVLLSTVQARAQEVGVVAAVEGRVEIRRDGAWRIIDLGEAVYQSDEIRTGEGRVRVVFDPTGTRRLEIAGVVTLQAHSHFIVTEALYTDNPGPRFTFNLVGGGMKWVTAPLLQKISNWDGWVKIETAVALAFSTRTEFGVRHEADTTGVVCIAGEVAVYGAGGLRGKSVRLSAGESTSVGRGGAPSPPVRISPDVFRQWHQTLQFVGAGQRESLSAPLLAAAFVGPDELRGPLRRLERFPEDEDVSVLVGHPPKVLQNGGELEIDFE